MRHYVAVVAVMLVFFLAIFALVEAAGIPLLTDPTDQLTGAGPAVAAAVGFGLLVVDVVLPVPSSVIMLLNGALFGVVIGTLISLAGSLGAALVGFAIGRRGGKLLDRLVPPDERQRADALLERWGSLAIVVTRPVPVLAETTAILAGATRSFSWRRMTVATLIGALPAAVLYATAGAFAASFTSLTLVFAIVLVLAAVTWLVERLFRARAQRSSDAGEPETAGGAP